MHGEICRKCGVMFLCFNGMCNATNDTMTCAIRDHTTKLYESSYKRTEVVQCLRIRAWGNVLGPPHNVANQNEPDLSQIYC